MTFQRQKYSSFAMLNMDPHRGIKPSSRMTGGDAQHYTPEFTDLSVLNPSNQVTHCQPHLKYENENKPQRTYCIEFYLYFFSSVYGSITEKQKTELFSALLQEAVP